MKRSLATARFDIEHSTNKHTRCNVSKNTIFNSLRFVSCFEKITLLLTMANNISHPGLAWNWQSVPQKLRESLDLVGSNHPVMENYEQRRAEAAVGGHTITVICNNGEDWSDCYDWGLAHYDKEYGYSTFRKGLKIDFGDYHRTMRKIAQGSINEGRLVGTNEFEIPLKGTGEYTIDHLNYISVCKSHHGPMMEIYQSDPRISRVQDTDNPTKWRVKIHVYEGTISTTVNLIVCGVKATDWEEERRGCFSNRPKLPHVRRGIFEPAVTKPNFETLQTLVQLHYCLPKARFMVEGITMNRAIAQGLIHLAKPIPSTQNRNAALEPEDAEHQFQDNSRGLERCVQNVASIFGDTNACKVFSSDSPNGLWTEDIEPTATGYCPTLVEEAGKIREKDIMCELSHNVALLNAKNVLVELGGITVGIVNIENADLVRRNTADWKKVDERSWRFYITGPACPFRLGLRISNFREADVDSLYRSNCDTYHPEEVPMRPSDIFALLAQKFDAGHVSFDTIEFTKTAALLKLLLE